MLEFGSFPTVAQATLVVVTVLVEAVILYVGYGHLESQFAPGIATVFEKV